MKIGVFPKLGVSQNGCFFVIMENPIIWMIFGVIPIFWKHPYVQFSCIPFRKKSIYNVIIFAFLSDVFFGWHLVARNVIPPKGQRKIIFSTQNGHSWAKDMLVPRRVDIGALPPIIMVWGSDMGENGRLVISLQVICCSTEPWLLEKD